ARRLPETTWTAYLALPSGPGPAAPYPSCDYRQTGTPSWRFIRGHRLGGPTSAAPPGRPCLPIRRRRPGRLGPQHPHAARLLHATRDGAGIVAKAPVEVGPGGALDGAAGVLCEHQAVQRLGSSRIGG